MGEKEGVMGPKEVQNLARKFHQISRLGNSLLGVILCPPGSLGGSPFHSAALKVCDPKAGTTSPLGFHRMVPQLKPDAIWPVEAMISENLVSLLSLNCSHLHPNRASLVAQLVENPPAIQETSVRFLGQEAVVEKR